MLTTKELLGRAQALEPQLVEWRRTLHRHPEVGFDLTQTKALVKKYPFLQQVTDSLFHFIYQSYFLPFCQRKAWTGTICHHSKKHPQGCR